MVWDGSIRRRITHILPNGSDGWVMHFECQHTEDIDAPPIDVLTGASLYKGEAVCHTCSRPFRERIAAHQSSVDFDDVIQKLKRLAQDHSELIKGD